LAAYRRVHLRQKCGRYLDEWHTSEIRCCREPGQIADNTTAERDDGRCAFAAMMPKRIKNEIEGLPVLVFFSVRKNDRVRGYPMTGEGPAQPFQIKRGHGRVGHDRYTLLRQVFQDEFGPIQDAFAD